MLITTKSDFLSWALDSTINCLPDTSMWMLTGYSNLLCPIVTLPPLSPCSGKCFSSYFKPDLRALPQTITSHPPRSCPVDSALLPPAPCHCHSLISSLYLLSPTSPQSPPNLIASFLTTFHLLPVVFTVDLDIPFWSTEWSCHSLNGFPHLWG